MSRFARDTRMITSAACWPEELKAASCAGPCARSTMQRLWPPKMQRSGEIVAEQEKHGLPVVTDGEYRRLNWQVSFRVSRGWDMWEGSGGIFSRSPTISAREKPLQRGADAVESFKIPATASSTRRKLSGAQNCAS